MCKDVGTGGQSKSEHARVDVKKNEFTEKIGFGGPGNVGGRGMWERCVTVLHTGTWTWRVVDITDEKVKRRVEPRQLVGGWHTRRPAVGLVPVSS